MKSCLIALLLLLVVGGVGYGIYLAVQPETVTAKARFLVEAETPSWNLAGEKRPLTERQIRRFRETTAGMVVSPAVLSAALQNPTLQGTFLANESSPQGWLEENLEVGFDGQSQLLEVSVAGPSEDMNDLKAIIDAVTQAYLDEVVMKNRFEGAKDLERLRSSYAEYQMQLREKLTELAEMRARSGDSATGSADVRIRELEVQSLEKFHTLIADKIQQMNLDLERPTQIKLVDPAYVLEN